jgi:hypothetical protein
MILVFFSLVLYGCGNKNQKSADVNLSVKQKQESDSNDSKKILVAYFSCTGNTKGVAKHIASETGADLYEITPKIPYTDEDLNYNNSNSRATKEQNDDNARPEIEGKKLDISQYDTIVVATPLWWSDAPRIICTFLESYDFTGKTLIPVCTSQSSEPSGVEKRMHSVCKSNVTWKPIKRFGTNFSENEVKEWVDSWQ